MIRGARKSFSMTVIFEHYCWTIFGFLNNQHVEANHFLTEQSPACIRPDILSPPLENYTVVKKKSPVPNPPFLGIRLFSRKTNGWKLKKIHHWGPKADSELGKSHFFGGFCRWVFGTVSFPGNSLRKWRFWDVELTWSFDSQVVKVTLLMFGAKKLGHFAWITWVPKKNPKKHDELTPCRPALRPM